VPFIGDAIGVLLSSYILSEAARMGASRTILARMAFNIAVEGVIGIVPLAGDVFDAAWKANLRNVRLLNAWLDRPHRAQRSSLLFLAGLVAALVAFVVVVGLLVYYMGALLAGSVG